MKKTILAFISAVLCTALIASLLSTQSVVASLQDVGVQIDLLTRLKMTLTDLAAIKLLGIIVAACFLVGFLVAKFSKRYLGGSRLYWLIAAGASAWPCALLLLSYQLQLMPIAGARTNLGLLAQSLAGAAGGLLFAKMTADQYLTKDT